MIKSYKSIRKLDQILKGKADRKQSERDLEAESERVLQLVSHVSYPIRYVRHLPKPFEERKRGSVLLIGKDGHFCRVGVFFFLQPIRKRKNNLSNWPP